MSYLALGEDLFGIVIAVGLVSAFALVLGSSLSACRDYQDGLGESRLLLSVSDYIRNGSHPRLKGEPPVVAITGLERQLDELLNNMMDSGTRFRISVFTIDDELLFRSETVLDDPTRSVSLPIVCKVERVLVPARLIVEMEV